MRKHVPGDKSIEAAYKRKTERELAARGIVLQPDVPVSNIKPEVVVEPVKKKLKVKKEKKNGKRTNR